MTTATILRPAFTVVDKAASELRALLDAPWDHRPGHHRPHRGRIFELRSQLARTYAKRNGWIVGQTSFHPGQLARRSNQSTRAEAREYFSWAWGPTFDHITFMREPDGWRLPAAIISQSYHVEPKQLADFCNRWNLYAKVEESFPSWWRPGGAALLVFTPQARTYQRT